MAPAPATRIPIMAASGMARKCRTPATHSGRRDDKIGRAGLVQRHPAESRGSWCAGLHPSPPPICCWASETTRSSRLARPVNAGNSGIYTFTQVTNDLPYFLWLAPGNSTDAADGPYTEPEQVTPKADPDQPTGAVSINDGAPATRSLNVLLNITSTDTPLTGLSTPASASWLSSLQEQINEISAGIEMRISNSPDFSGAVWQPLTQYVPWQLQAGPNLSKVVYIQFRDAAQNESLVFWDDITYTPRMFLPVLAK